MENFTWQKEKEKREKAALERHTGLSELFKKDRLTFERKRKKMIDELIDSVEDGEQRRRLRDIQVSWDKKMRGAGTTHNRFVLAKTFFWEHFHEVWHPAIERYNKLLNGKPDGRNP